ncbi:hypothetical protein BDZ94DRAFT_1266390 [Collybia nuda]|uniref:DUF6533 domain-containing protein n=1 Tax=Collybia nuda TaxID=64659 RepID=A0A9P5Y2K4_9AGAR|nr:hypothetical protein BDZ94DRAFT_1266390 [Collybia nuda]
MSAPPMTPAMVRAIETSAFHLFISKYYALAATAMLVYDTFLTFDREVDAIWRSQWTAVKALFFFNRYANIGAYVTSIVAINSTWPRDSCLRYVIFPGIFNLIQQVVIGSILMLYTYALFNRSKTVFAITFTVFLVQIVVIGWSLGAITAVPLPRGFVGCIYAGKTGTGIRVQTSWIMQLVFISVAFGLMIWKAITLKKCQVRAPLVTIMTKDGLKYFGVIFTANFVNVMNFSLVKVTQMDSFLNLLSDVSPYACV